MMALSVLKLAATTRPTLFLSPVTFATSSSYNDAQQAQLPSYVGTCMQSCRRSYSILPEFHGVISVPITDQTNSL